MITIKETIATFFWEKSICILWFWKEWKSTLTFLKECWIDAEKIAIHDSNEISVEWYTTHCWETYLNAVDQYDIIIRTAGLSPHKPELASVQEKITSQTELFFKFFPNKTIMVTGTKGKSTTVSLLSKMFHLAWMSYELIGNIWVPPLDLLMHEHLSERAILECSSYQLDWLTATPTIWILTSLYHEHHAERHGGDTPYFMSKIRGVLSCETKLFCDEIEEDYSILAYDLLRDKTWTVHKFGRTWTYRFWKKQFRSDSETVTTDQNMKLKGKHNRYNACAVLWVCDLLKIEKKFFIEAIQSFAWLEHRLEDCWIYWWIRWVNDAISTTPQSTIAALYSLWNIETLFLWGKDWWYDFKPMIDVITSLWIKNIVLFWDSWKIIQPLIPSTIKTLSTNSMKEAVQRSYQVTSHNAICLLSCASPSYWIRKNFEEKGTLFKQELQKLPQAV